MGIDREKLVAHQVAVGKASAVQADDRAVDRAQLRFVDVEAPSGFADKNVTNLRCGVADRRSGILHGMTGGCVAFVRSQAGVGRDERKVGERNLQLFRRDLKQCRFQALTEFCFAAQNCDRAACIDSVSLGIQARRIIQAAR